MYADSYQGRQRGGRRSSWPEDVLDFRMRSEMSAAEGSGKLEIGWGRGHGELKKMCCRRREGPVAQWAQWVVDHWEQDPTVLITTWLVQQYWDLTEWRMLACYMCLWRPSPDFLQSRSSWHPEVKTREHSGWMTQSRFLKDQVSSTDYGDHCMMKPVDRECMISWCWGDCQYLRADKLLFLILQNEIRYDCLVTDSVNLKLNDINMWSEMGKAAAELEHS